MGDMRVIKVKQSVLANNDSRAEALRAELKSNKVFLINLMSSPGAGKTTMLVKLINMLKGKLRIGVIEADVVVRRNLCHAAFHVLIRDRR